nr:collagen alpha-1(I) chain-like [Aegilops tauschii subsp. strangulata]
MVCPGAASSVDGGGDDGDPTSGVAAEPLSATGDTGRGDASGWAEPGDEGEPGGDGSPGDAAGDLAMPDAGEAGWADPGETGDAAGDPVGPAVVPAGEAGGAVDTPAGEADEAASGDGAWTLGPCTSITPTDAGAATVSWEEIRAASAENKSMSLPSNMVST